MEKKSKTIAFKSEYLVVYENIIDANISCQMVFVMQQKTMNPIQMFVNLPESRSIIYLPTRNKLAHAVYREITELLVDMYEYEGIDKVREKVKSLRQEEQQGKRVAFKDPVDDSDTPKKDA
jgi:hypothetical protein